MIWLQQSFHKCHKCKAFHENGPDKKFNCKPLLFKFSVLYLEMIRKIVTPGEFFVTMGAFIVSVIILLNLRVSFFLTTTYLFPLCSATCLCQLLFTVNWRPHSLQTKGLIPLEKSELTFAFLVFSWYYYL